MNSSALLIAFAILSSSFWGSWHCAAMCSPVASIAAQKKALWLYHFGRLMSYASIGALGGWIGSIFLENSFYQVRLFSSTFYALILLLLGVQTYRGKAKLAAPNFTWLHSLYRPRRSAFFLGMLSAFLPCGWLYSYVLAAAVTRSALSGATVMALFWLGSVPALSAVSLFMKTSIGISPLKRQRIASLVLIFAALYSLCIFYFVPPHQM